MHAWSTKSSRTAPSTYSAPSTRRDAVNGCMIWSTDNTSQRFKWALSVTTRRFVSSSPECLPWLHDGHRDVRTSRHCAAESQLLAVVDDYPLLLDLRQRGVEIRVHNIAAVHETVRHVLTAAKVTIGQRACRLKVAAMHEVHTLARDEIRLDLSDIQVQRTVENWEGPSRGDELRKQAVQERTCRELDVQNTAENVQHNLVFIEQTRQALTQNNEICELKQGRHARQYCTAPRRPSQFARESTPRSRVSINTSIRRTNIPETYTRDQSRNTYCRPRNIPRWCWVRVRNVRGVLFSRSRLLGVKGVACTCSRAHNQQTWFKIDEDRSWHMLPCTCFEGEIVEHVVTSTDGLVTWLLAVRLCATSETRRGHLILHQVLHRDGGVASVRRWPARAVQLTMPRNC